jgi:glycine/D-amino acid oxidase-like deaminating enzyme
MSTSRADVVIIGAGIVGAAIADRLSAVGKRVHVVGKALAGGATGAGMGHVLVLDESPELFAFTRAGKQSWHQLAPELPANCEWQQAGTLWVAENEGQRLAAVDMGRRLLGGGVDAQLVDAKELEQLEPALRPGLAGALHIADDATIYQPAALLGDRLPVAVGPKKGQLIITERTSLRVRHHLVELGYTQSVGQRSGASVAFNVQPRMSGQLLIGSSRAYVGGRDFDRELAARMLERAFEFLPGLREVAGIRAWTGIRCASEDGRPLIGPIDANGRILVASGHEGYGITTSLVTGDLIAAWLGEGELPTYAEHFTPHLARREQACA